MSALKEVFPDSRVVDRRKSPQYGYRAVHVIVRDGNRRFEIQLRTELQDKWANIVEKIDDRFRTELKYGVGDATILDRLAQASKSIAKIEDFQQRFEVPTPTGYGKTIIATYGADYKKALDVVWPDAERRGKKRWQAACRRATKRGYSWASNDARNHFPLSCEWLEAWTEVEAYADRFLRLVLWSSTKLEIGTGLVLGGNGMPWPLPVFFFTSLPMEDAGASVERHATKKTHSESSYGVANVVLKEVYRPWQKEATKSSLQPVTILRENTSAGSLVTAPTFGDLHEGHIYEITQPADPEVYFTDEDGFRDFVNDVRTDFLNLEQLLE